MDANTEKLGSEISCSNCGGKLTFQPGTTALVCKACGTTNQIQVDHARVASATQELDYHAYLNRAAGQAPTRPVLVMGCNGCGAKTSMGENVSSGHCDFCGAPLVAKQPETFNQMAPRAMLPFAIEENRAHQAYRTWLEKLWFAPNDLKKFARDEGRLTGAYLPYWTYDARTATQYTGERGDDYQTTETYTEDGQTKTRTVTKTRWTSVSGRVRRDFDDVLVPASDSLPRKYLDELEPWDLAKLVPFEERFLSGFKTEMYSVDLKAGFEIAKDKMDAIIRQDIRGDIGGDHQRISSVSTQHSGITFKHILLPVWIGAFSYRDKSFRFMVNARTGEVQGERPYSWIKITLLVLFILAIIALIVYMANQ